MSRSTADEQRLGPHLGPGRIGPGDRDRQQPAIGRFAGARIDEVMDLASSGRPSTPPDGRGRDRQVAHGDDGQRLGAARRVLHGDRPRAIGRRAAGDQVAAGIEQERRQPGRVQPVPRPAQGQTLADAAQVERVVDGDAATPLVDARDASRRARGPRRPGATTAPRATSPSRSRSTTTRASNRPAVRRAARSQVTTARASRRPDGHGPPVTGSGVEPAELAVGDGTGSWPLRPPRTRRPPSPRPRLGRRRRPSSGAAANPSPGPRRSRSPRPGTATARRG